MARPVRTGVGATADAEVNIAIPTQKPRVLVNPDVVVTLGGVFYLANSSTLGRSRRCSHIGNRGPD